MHSPDLRRVAAAVAVCLVGLLIPPAAAAATSEYPPDAAARGFSGGLAGWTTSSSVEGTCLPPLICPSATNSFEPEGGADGGGFIRTSLQGIAGVNAVGGRTTAVFASPRFTYRGADGEAASTVTFEMDRRANVDQFLAVAGNSATYSVRLVDISAGGETLTVVPPTTLAGANSWRDIPAAPLGPGRLMAGHDYRILITSTYVTGTSAVASGSADYDNVVLGASSADGRVRGGRRGSREGREGLSSQRLSDLVAGVTPGTAVVAGNGKRLLVRVKCPRQVDGACRIGAQGMLRKGKPATRSRRAKVRSGKAKLLVLSVKPKARAKVLRRKRLLVRHRVRAGKATTTVFKKRKLIRR